MPEEKSESFSTRYTARGYGETDAFPVLFGRRHFQKEIEEFLNRKTRGHLIIVGSPGVGKSTLMATLARGPLKAHPLIHLGRTLGQDEPASFFATLTVFLKEKYGEPFEPAARPVGEAARIFYDFLEGIGKKGVREVILIDGLEQAPGILEFIPPHLPDGISFISTTRPGAHLLPFRGKANVKIIRWDDYSFENLNDALAFLKAGFENIPVGDDLFERMLYETGGSFLELDTLIEAARKASFRMSALPDLPDALAATFERYLRELLQAPPGMEPEDLYVVLGLITASREELTLDDIVDFSGLPRIKVLAIIDALRPFLSTGSGLSGEIYRIYSNRFRRFLRACFGSDLSTVHARIVDYYRGLGAEPDRLPDRYAWKNLVYHYFEAAQGARRKDYSSLYGLLTEGYLVRKLEKEGSLLGTLEDIKLAVRSALETYDLTNLSRFGLLYPKFKIDAILGLLPLIDAARFPEAAFRASLFRHESIRCKALLLVAHGAVQMGDIESARSIVDAALRIPGNRIAAEDTRFLLRMMEDFLVHGVTEVVELLFRDLETVDAVRNALKLSKVPRLDRKVRIALVERAAEKSKELTPDSLRADATAELANELIELGEKEKAREISDRAPRPLKDEEKYEKEPEIYTIIRNLAALKKSQWPKEAFDRILTAAEKLGSSARKAFALSAILKGLMEFSDAPWAKESFLKLISLVKSVSIEDDRFKVISEISLALADFGRTPWGQEAFEKLGACAEKLNAKNFRPKALADVGAGMMRVGQILQGKALVRAALAAVEEPADPMERSLLAAYVAGDLFIADDPAWARAVFIKSLSHSEENVTGHPAMFSLSSVACNLSSVGDGERAREFFNKSLELAQGVPEPNIRAGMLCALAGGLWAMEEFDRAREVFKTAMEAARKTLDPFVRTRVLATIAENLARVKERQWAWESFEEAAGAAEKVPAEGARADALAFTAGKLVAVGEAQWAKDIAIKALKALGKSKDVNRGRVEAMASLSTVLAAAGEADQAREVLAGGRELAVGLHDRFESSWAWNALAKSCLVLGEVEAAVELLGKIKDLHAVSDARIACARYLLKRSSGEALDLIAGIPLFFERMRGIADAALDLTRDHLLPESSEAGTLSELTIMSLEDPITSDFVASRWLLQSQERDVLFKAGMEMGRSAQTVDKKAVDG